MSNKNIAVSPVIGVLLMLTLTLIIAAIVNSYAGGLMQTESKAPSVTMQTSYSLSQGLKLQHMSGDPFSTASVKLITRPGETMGRNASQYSAEINKSYITDTNGSRSWTSGITSMKPGDIYTILGNYQSTNFTYLTSGIPTDYQFANKDSLGETFFVEMYYHNQMISRNEVLIEG